MTGFVVEMFGHTSTQSPCTCMMRFIRIYTVLYKCLSLVSAESVSLPGMAFFCGAGSDTILEVLCSSDIVQSSSLESDLVVSEFSAGSEYFYSAPGTW